MSIKYFIEDLDTQLWYREVPFNEYPKVHTFGKGWDKPKPEKWTKDPLQAKQFDTRNEAITFLSDGLKYKDNGHGFMEITLFDFTKSSDLDNRRDLPKNLIITEHEFVD